MIGGAHRDHGVRVGDSELLNASKQRHLFDTHCVVERHLALESHPMQVHCVVEDFCPWRQHSQQGQSLSNNFRPAQHRVAKRCVLATEYFEQSCRRDIDTVAHLSEELIVTRLEFDIEREKVNLPAQLVQELQHLVRPS